MNAAYQPQLYDKTMIRRFLNNEISEIAVEMKRFDGDCAKGASIENVELVLDLIKCNRPHAVTVKSSYEDDRNPEAVIVFFRIDEETVGLEDFKAIKRLSDCFDLVGASQVGFDVIEGSARKRYTYEFRPISGITGPYSWIEVD